MKEFEVRVEATQEMVGYLDIGRTRDFQLRRQIINAPTNSKGVNKMKNYTGSDLGQDFRTFYAKEKKRITSQLTAMNCKDIQMSRQFYYYSGFFTTAEGQPYYFSISDVRFFPELSMLYRKVRDYKDYTGGANCFLSGHNMHEMRLI